MEKRIQFYLIVAAVIVVFDLVASVISKTFEIDYVKLGWISWGLYFLAGYLACKYFDLPSGIIAGLVAGLADSTVGWLISWSVHPYMPFAQPQYTVPLIIVIVAFVAATGMFTGLLGALLFKIVQRISR
jgi:hypothetical protein